MEHFQKMVIMMILYDTILSLMTSQGRYTILSPWYVQRNVILKWYIHKNMVLPDYVQKHSNTTGLFSYFHLEMLVSLV